MLKVVDVRVLRGHGGGPEKTLARSARYLRKLGYEVVCIYMCDPSDKAAQQTIDRIRDEGTEVHVVYDRGPFDIRLPLALCRLIRKLDPAVYHAHDYKSSILAGILGRRCVRVTTLHGWVHYNARLRLYYAAEKHCLKQFARVYCVSQELYRLARRCGVSVGRLYYLPNGIVVDEFTRSQEPAVARTKFGLPEEGFFLGAVGRLSAEKNLVILIETISYLRKKGVAVWGLLVGDGPLRGALESRAYELGVRDYIIFAGYQKDVRPWLECMDAYLCSSVREGMPNSVLEAMAMEVPVIATRVGDVAYMLDQGRVGLLLERGEADEMARLILDLMEGKIEGKVLAKGARRRVEREFSFEKRINLLAEDYDKLLSISKCRVH